MKVETAHLYQPVRFGQKLETWIKADRVKSLDYTPDGYLVVDTGEPDHLHILPPMGANIMYMRVTRQEWEACRSKPSSRRS